MSDNLRAALNQLHTPRQTRVPYSDNHKVPSPSECRHCHRPWPCPTAALLDRFPPEAEGEALRKIRSRVFCAEMDMFRSEAFAHAVAQPYADNRFIRLLDDMRRLAASPEEQDR